MNSNARDNAPSKSRHEEAETAMVLELDSDVVAAASAAAADQGKSLDELIATLLRGHLDL